MKRRSLITNSIIGGLSLTLMSKAFAGEFEHKEFGDWIEIPDTGGLSYKMVWTDGKNLARFFKLPPDHKFAHKHPKGEYTFIVKGCINIDDVMYVEGDDMYMPPGSCHAGYTLKTHECIVFTFHREEIIPLNPDNGCQ